MAAAIQLDQLSMIMMLIITGVGLLIHVFSVGYMQDDPGYPRYFAYLNLFIFFMLVLVMGASYPIMFIGWEGVGLCSYLLIGFWFSDEAKASAGKKAFIVNRIGDLGFLLAIFLLYLVFQRVDFAGIFGDAEAVFEYGGAVITTVTLFFLMAATGKSAQIPLYIWLPDAMAGPTPVSALIHAATMVTAGVYLVARSSVLFALAPLSSAVVAGIGCAYCALRRDDRLEAERHQKGVGLFHDLPVGLHVLGCRRGGVHGRHLSSHDTRLLQGAPVSGRRGRHPLDAPRPASHEKGLGRPGHAEYGWTQGPHAVHVDHHVARYGGDRRDLALRGLSSRRTKSSG